MLVIASHQSISGSLLRELKGVPNSTVRMKVNTISRKLIKPCTPTPQNLNKYKISFLDELGSPINLNLILFYPPNPKPTTITQLQESLANILPLFYPLAGRYIQKDHLVDCNDEGAEFVEAEANDIELIDLITKTNDEPLNDLLSRQAYEVDGPTDPLLSIQVTRFKCGELAIGISVSHRIFDAPSLETFIAAWCNASSHPDMGNTRITPSFDSPSLFPGRNLGKGIQRPRTRNPNIVVKRLLFNKEDIASLTSKISPESGERVSSSRVQVVSAVIAKALIGVESAKHGKSRDCFVAQPVNMRGRTISPLHKLSCGNLSAMSVVKCMAANDTNEKGLHELVCMFGDAIDKTISDIARVLPVGEDGHDATLDAMLRPRDMLKSGEVSVLLFSDWSEFGLYEADFGWGKPVWAGIGTMPRQHAMVFLDNKEGDGIEAWVHLNINDVPSFERYSKLAEMEGY